MGVDGRDSSGGHHVTEGTVVSVIVGAELLNEDLESSFGWFTDVGVCAGFLQDTSTRKPPSPSRYRSIEAHLVVSDLGIIADRADFYQSVYRSCPDDTLLCEFAIGGGNGADGSKGATLDQELANG